MRWVGQGMSGGGEVGGEVGRNVHCASPPLNWSGDNIIAIDVERLSYWLMFNSFMTVFFTPQQFLTNSASSPPSCPVGQLGGGGRS